MDSPPHWLVAMFLAVRPIADQRVASEPRPAPAERAAATRRPLVEEVDLRALRCLVGKMRQANAALTRLLGSSDGDEPKRRV